MQHVVYTRNDAKIDIWERGGTEHCASNSVCMYSEKEICDRSVAPGNRLVEISKSPNCRIVVRTYKYFTCVPHLQPNCPFLPADPEILCSGNGVGRHSPDILSDVSMCSCKTGM